MDDPRDTRRRTPALRHFGAMIGRGHSGRSDIASNNREHVARIIEEKYGAWHGAHADTVASAIDLRDRACRGSDFEFILAVGRASLGPHVVALSATTDTHHYLEWRPA